MGPFKGVRFERVDDSAEFEEFEVVAQVVIGRVFRSHEADGWNAGPEGSVLTENQADGVRRRLDERIADGWMGGDRHSAVLHLSYAYGDRGVDPLVGVWRLRQGQELRREHVGIRFKIGDLFDADDPVARWLTVCMSGVNDLILVNGWLIPRLEGDGPDHVNVYLGRLGASHLYEIAKFLHRSEKQVPEVRAFLDALDEEARAAHNRVKAAGPAGADAFASQLKRARDHFFHYARLVPQAPEHEKLRQAMYEHRNSPGEISDPGRTVDFRARFADEIFVELSFPEKEVDLGEFLATLSKRISDYLDFARAATNRYIELAPRECWEWIDVEEAEGGGRLGRDADAGPTS